MRAHLLLSLYAALLPVQISLSSSLRFAPADGALLLCLFAFAGCLRFRRGSWSWWHLGLVLLFAMGNLVTAMQVGRLGRWVLLQKDVGLLILLVGYLAITCLVEGREQRRSILQAFLISTCSLNLAAMAEFFLSRAGLMDLPWMNYGTARLAGMLIDPNAYGGLLVVALAIHLATGERTEGTGLVPGWAKGPVTLSLMAGIILTFSRSAWLGLAVVCMLLALLRPRSLVRLALTGLGALTLLLAAGAGSSDFFLQMAMRGNQVDARLDIIGEAFDLFARSPWIGVGIGEYGRLHGVIIHNTLIWFLTEFGLFGLLIFVGLAGWYLLRGWAILRRTPPGDRGPVLGLLLAHGAMLGLSLGVEALYQRHWWLAMALLVSVVPQGEVRDGATLADGDHGLGDVAGLPPAPGRSPSESGLAG